MRSYKSFCVTLFLAVVFAVSGCATYNINEIPQEESHVHINAKQKTALKQILHRHITEGFYIAPNIPPSKLANARRACFTPPDEEVFALVDSTVFGSAENSLLIGSSGVFFRNDWAGRSPGRHFLSYAEFQDAVFIKNNSYEVSIDGLNFDVSGSPMSKEAVINLLLSVQKVITDQYNPHDSFTEAITLIHNNHIDAPEINKLVFHSISGLEHEIDNNNYEVKKLVIDWNKLQNDQDYIGVARDVYDYYFNNLGGFTNNSIYSSLDNVLNNLDKHSSYLTPFEY